MDTINKYTASFGASLAITSILSAVLVVIKESSENTVLALMKNLTGHHWATHGLFIVLAFILIGFGLAKTNNGQGLKMTPERLIAVIVGAVVLSGLIIAGFYLFAD
jgi:uncharacterized Tic20 family protein